MTIVWWRYGVEHERELTAPAAARPSRAAIAPRSCRQRGGSTVTMPLGGRSGGGGRRPGEGQRRGRAPVARRCEARAHLSRARDASASHVVAEVALQTTTEMSLTQDDHVVEKLAADGPDHSLGEGVLPGGAWCRENLRDAHALHPSPKLAAVDAVSAAEEVARRRVIGERFDNLLRRPGGSGGIGDVEVHDLPAMM